MREELSENDSRRIRLIMALRQLEYEKKIQLTAELHKLNNKTKEGADLSILQSSSGDWPENPISDTQMTAQWRVIRLP